MTLLLIFTLISRTEQSEEKINEYQSFSLSGTISREYSDFIYLNYGQIKDSTKVVNALFKFRGTVEKTTMGYLHLKPYADVVSLYTENSNINIYQSRFYK